jgi:C1A family cysteine protease
LKDSQNLPGANNNDEKNLPAVTAIKHAMCEHGPLVTEANADTWQSYSGGVIPHTCPSDKFLMDWEALIVGWDDTKPGGGAWLVEPFFGSSWGEEGKIWIAYDEHACGIGRGAGYATVK